MMYENFGLLINGQWKTSQSNRTKEVTSPVTGKTIGSIPIADQIDIEEALSSVQNGFAIWSQTTPWERSNILRKIAVELQRRKKEAVDFMVSETGKPLAEADAELNASIEQFEWYADEARRIFGHSLSGRDNQTSLQVQYEAVGPVAALTAWNFPALLPSRKIAASLAAGCSVIVKPSDETPSAVFIIAKAAEAAGLPKGVLNILTGSSSFISSQLIASKIIKKISFTGSVPVGKLLLKQAADTVKKVSMELGGHAPVIVMPDVDPVKAAELCAQAKFRNAGQVCASPSRFFVHEDIYDVFVETMTQYAKSLHIGDGKDTDVNMGPLINERGRRRIEGLVEDALEKGAGLCTGGKIPEFFTEGFFYEPTVLSNVSDECKVMFEEPFGPIAPITKFTDYKEALKRANSVDFGLASYIFTNDLGMANKLANGLEAGMVGVNTMLLASAEMPFGGVKESGFGREGGKLGIYDYLQPKFIKLSSIN